MFRTDIVQFVLVGGMACALAVSSLVRGLPAHWNIVLLPRQGYWEAQALGTSLALYGYQFVVGMIIGAGFLAVCPDAWKRVFIVTRKRRKARMRFLVFSAAGVLPFLLIPAVSLTGQRIPDGAVNVGLMFSGLLTSDPMLVCATLALVGSFLSAFNSAVLAAVHTGLIFRRVSASTEDETPRFHWLMVSALLCTAFLFLALVSAGNPYLLSNLLMGLFAIIAGIQIGAWGAGSRLPGNSMLWMIVVGCVGWFVYVISVVGVPTAPSTYQINTVPGGAALVAVSGIIAHWLYRKGRNSVRL